MKRRSDGTAVIDESDVNEIAGRVVRGLAISKADERELRIVVAMRDEKREFLREHPRTRPEPHTPPHWRRLYLIGPGCTSRMARAKGGLADVARRWLEAK